MSAITKSIMLDNVETILADAAKRIQAATNNPNALIDVSLRNSTFDFISESARNIADMVNELAVSHGLEPITKQFNTITI